ncbi:hypothetical protein [Sulfuricurvum sp.]|uniref:hypothetical protein n=1 Tax=Sulfuricurvum sp. TaxID=2025608 RepID=UPI00260E32CF|nr:hypothetical protein [Sulfuricurvum sp.]MDD3594910.1 hypothetical protein [Sulfuricurvum sp.]
MHPEMLVTSTGEVWLLSVLLLIGAGFILYGRGAEFVFVGMVVIVGVFTIAYSNHTRYLGERYLMEQFHEGRALSCGMWKGESARVDRLSGWKYEEGTGFVKGDVIINDPGVCRVIGRVFPEPSSVPYWMVLVTVVGVLMILRVVTLGVEEEKDDARAE